jgi:CubicO group peptidase (beta-lactamase class C family)
MADTTFDARPLRRRVVPMAGIDIGNRLAAEVLLWFLARVAMPGGGLFGTVPDLLRLGRALLTPNGATETSGAGSHTRILSRPTVARMAEQQVEGIPLVAEDGTVSYVEQGLGWRRSEGGWPPGDAVLTHGGHSGSRLWIDPERDLAFAFLTNLWGVTSEAPMTVLEQVYRARP